MASTDLLPLLKEFGDGEPRARDLDLAKVLGYTDPYMLRKRIARQRETLEEFGLLVTVTESLTGGRKGEAFWLNRRQALAIGARTETAIGDEILVVLVNTFDAYVERKLVPAEATVEMSVLDVEKRQIVNVLQPLLRQALLPFEHKIELVENRVAVVETKLDAGFKAVLDTLHGVDEKVSVVADDARRRRKKVKLKDRCRMIDCLHVRRHGVCPCCHLAAILDENGDPNALFQVDHFFGRHQIELQEVWPVCSDCNLRLEDTRFRKERNSEFHAWLHLLAIHLDPPLLRGIRAL